MKRVIFTFMMITAAVLSFPATAQTLSGGIEAGFNVSRPTATDANKAGFNVGVFGELGLTRGWYLDAALKLTLNPWEKSYSYYGSWNPEGTDVSGESSKLSVSPYSLRLPVHVGKKFNVASGVKLFAAVGSYIGVGLGGSATLRGTRFINVSADSNGFVAEGYREKVKPLFGDDGFMNRFQVGVDARIGVEFIKHYIVSLSYDYQFNNMSSVSGQNRHGQDFCVNLGYRF